MTVAVRHVRFWPKADMSGAFPGSGSSRYDARVPCFGGGNGTARVHYASRWRRGSDAAHRKM